MANAPVWQTDFDRDADFTVLKVFTCNGIDQRPDTPFDKTLVSTRTLRQLFDQRYLDQHPVVKKRLIKRSPPAEEIAKRPRTVAPPKPSTKAPKLRGRTGDLVVKRADTPGKWAVFRRVPGGYTKVSRPMKSKSEADAFRRANQNK